MPPPAPGEPAESAAGETQAPVPACWPQRRPGQPGSAPLRVPPGGRTNSHLLRNDAGPWVFERGAPAPIAVRAAAGSHQHRFRAREGGPRGKHRPSRACA